MSVDEAEGADHSQYSGEGLPLLAWPHNEMIKEDSRYEFVIYTIIQNIIISKSGPLHGQCNYMLHKHKRIYLI